MILLLIIFTASVSFLLGAAIASLRKPPLQVRSPDPHLTPLVPAVPTQTRRRHPGIWTN